MAMAGLGDDLSDWVDSLLEQTALVTGNTPVPIDDVETDNTLFWTDGQETVESGIRDEDDQKEHGHVGVLADRGAAQAKVLDADVLSGSEEEVDENEDSTGDGEGGGETHADVEMGDEGLLFAEHAMQEDELGVESGEGEVESIVAGNPAGHAKGEEEKRQDAGDRVGVEGGASLGTGGNGDEAGPMGEAATQVRCNVFFG